MVHLNPAKYNQFPNLPRTRGVTRSAMLHLKGDVYSDMMGDQCIEVLSTMQSVQQGPFDIAAAVQKRPGVTQVVQREIRPRRGVQGQFHKKEPWSIGVRPQGFAADNGA